MTDEEVVEEEVVEEIEEMEEEGVSAGGTAAEEMLRVAGSRTASACTSGPTTPNTVSL